MSKTKTRTVLIVVGACVLLFIGMISLTNYLVSGALPFARSIVVIEVKGVIIESDEIVREIKGLRERSDVAAVVLRVDSPGGGVAPSQEIYEELKKLADEKVLVVSMGGVAASGGYYISCAADYIFANPGTTTGSIGVILETVNIEGALDKIGVEGVVIKSGELKDVGSPFRDMSQKEKQFLQAYVENVYQQFIETVKTSRKLNDSEVSAISDARILTGEQALELHMIDELGNLEDAIDKAAKLSGITGKPNVVYPKKGKLSLLALLIGEERTNILDNLTANYFRIEYRFVP